MPADGSDGGSKGVCGAGPDATSASLDRLYAAMVGTVPDPAIVRVEVRLNGRTTRADVVAQYFAIAPPEGLAPSSVTGSVLITGFYADGKRLGAGRSLFSHPSIRAHRRSQDRFAIRRRPHHNEIRDNSQQA